MAAAAETTGATEMAVVAENEEETMTAAVAETLRGR